MYNNILPEMLDRKVIYESDWVSLYSDKVKMPNGHIFDTYHKLHYPHESVWDTANSIQTGDWGVLSVVVLQVVIIVVLCAEFL